MLVVTLKTNAKVAQSYSVNRSCIPRHWGHILDAWSSAPSVWEYNYFVFFRHPDSLFHPLTHHPSHG